MRNVRAMGFLNPGLLLAMEAVNLVSGVLEEPGDAHWEAVVTGLQLSGAQQAEVAALHRFWQQGLEGVMAERQRLLSRMEAAPAPPLPSAVPPHRLSVVTLPTTTFSAAAIPAEGLFGDASTSSMAGSTDEQLERSLSKELHWHTCVPFLLLIQDPILSPLQIAKLCSASFPFIPNCRAVVSAVRSSMA